MSKAVNLRQAQVYPEQRRGVIITGGAGGIGLATAKVFAQNGFAVCSVDIATNPELDSLIKSCGGLSVEADVTDFDKAHQIAGEVFKKYGNLSALVTCAGSADNTNILDADPTKWFACVHANIAGTFNYIRAVSKYMKEQKYGSIVTIGSTAALRARRNISAYITSKSAIMGLTRAAARDLGRYNINVNCVVPGLVLTKLTECIQDDTKVKLRDETCFGRLSTPEQIASVIYMLASTQAEQITGEMIRVDGGQLA